MFSQRWQTIIDSIDYSLAKHAVFHEDPHCPAAAPTATLRRVERPGRAVQCPRCVRHTAAASLAS